MSSWVLLGTILIILNTWKRQEDTFNILPACEHVILNPASLKWARSAALVFLRELWWSSSLCKWMLGLFGLSWSRFTEWRGVSTSCSHTLSLQAEQPLVAPPAGRTHADLQRQISDQSVIDDLLLLSRVQQRFCGGLLFSFISCWSSEREPLYIENWRYLHSTWIRMYCILTCMYTSTVLLFMYYPFLWCALPFWQDTISSKKHLIFMHVCYLKKFGFFFCEHMGWLLLFLVFPNRNLIIFVLSIHPNLPFFHQVSVWCSAVWSILTVGTAMQFGGCAASRRTNTVWGLALCVGPTSWLSWASWTLSFSPFWLLFWGTDRTGSCQRSCWQRARVSIGDNGKRWALVNILC